MSATTEKSAADSKQTDNNVMHWLRITKDDLQYRITKRAIEGGPVSSSILANHPNWYIPYEGAKELLKLARGRMSKHKEE
jgi:hypothetical protein